MKHTQHLLNQIEKAKHKDLIKDYSVTHNGDISYIYVTFYSHTPPKTKNSLLAYIVEHYLCQAILSNDLLSIMVPSLSQEEFNKWITQQLKSTDSTSSETKEPSDETTEPTTSPDLTER